MWHLHSMKQMILSSAWVLTSVSFSYWLNIFSLRDVGIPYSAKKCVSTSFKMWRELMPSYNQEYGYFDSQE